MRLNTRTLLALAFAAALPAATPAKIDLVTLPSRDATELTIYNSADLTLVRETRTLAFTKGSNEIQFSWANTLIDPTSLHIAVPAGSGLVIQDAVYPANTKDLIVWNIVADKDTAAPIEITYFCSGLTWAADYIVKADAAEKTFALQQFTTVRNGSGEDFTDATTRVVVGTVNLTELIADLARKGINVTPQEVGGAVMNEWDMRNRARREVAMMAMPAPAAAMDASFEMKKAKEIIRQAVSEYYVLAVEGKEDIRNGWGKELPSPTVAAIPFDLSYEIDPNRYGPAPVKFYKLKNDKKHQLGVDPLPEGEWYVYSDDGKAGLRIEGKTSHKYVPVGEDVELNLGTDGLLVFERRDISSTRSNFDFDSNGNLLGWSETWTKELELRNARDRAVPVKLTEYFSGDWELLEDSEKSFEKVDGSSIRWNLQVPANQKKVVRYVVRMDLGSRANTN